jgi:hypothetical protein
MAAQTLEVLLEKLWALGAKNGTGNTKHTV